MPTLERGKGKRKQVIQITQRGPVLCFQETEAGDRRLPGYRRFSDEAAATNALANEVRAQLGAGMQPADDKARAIAASQPKKVTAPALPVRQDLAIYNEATGFVVTSRKSAGKTLEEGSAEWKEAVTRGDMLPLTLIQDDPFIVRVVAGAPLTPQEDEEWVARVDWHLNVPDGKLCVTGGSVFTNDDYDADDPSHEEYVGQVAIPAGRYRAAVYTHVHGVNGGSVLDHLAGGYSKAETLETWFARTRPGEAPTIGEDAELVDFLVHLEPIDATPKSGLSTLPTDGWFGGLENARKPVRCPLGLIGHDIVRTARDESPGKWTYVRHVFEDMPSLDRSTVSPAAVSLAIGSVASALRIAWFGSRLSIAELRLTAPAGSSLDLSGAWPEGIVAVEEGAVGRVLFDADMDLNTIITRLPELTPRLEALPDGTVLDVCCMPVENMPGINKNAGLLSLRGVTRAGHWEIAEAYPAVGAPTLNAALSLAGEIATGSTTIGVQDTAEGHAILAWARRNFTHHLKDNPPALADRGIRFKKPGPEVAMLAIAAFAHRFADTWPVVDLGTDDVEDEDDGDGLFPTKPIKGAEVLKAASGRVYHATMAMLVSQKVGEEIPKRERPLFGAGFKHVGDIVCSAFEDVGIRGYARPGGNTWACFRVSAPDEIAFELVSTFPATNAILITTGSAHERDETDSDTYRQGFAGANVKELIAHHEQRLTELTQNLGTPQPVVPKLQNLAEAIEAVVLKL